MPRRPSTLSPDGLWGWQCSTNKHTVFVESAIPQAAYLQWMDGNPLTGITIEQSDAGSGLDLCGHRTVGGKLGYVVQEPAEPNTSVKSK